MRNEIWRLNSDYLAAYTEDPDVWRKIKRSYGFKVMAEYYRNGKLFAMQYVVPNEKKRSIRHLLGVNVTCDKTAV
ncbi:hypothetical protein DNHGIG_23880 [Collibacillus ludicampi]|uniref:Uncharacterized protein n=1 Tax=Collibacillus ludicampi TaxID=2771369 RepID=A0AAV4LH63_9BACL|nr:hypothetical protein [Collibacillus ludicampi]GIM46839.1 hypothetical protein DNHGIG_23880 [Collibacillus ludicampi]